MAYNTIAESVAQISSEQAAAANTQLLREFSALSSPASWQGTVHDRK